MRKPSGIIVLIIHSEFKNNWKYAKTGGLHCFCDNNLNNYRRVEKQLCYKAFCFSSKIPKLSNMPATALGLYSVQETAGPKKRIVSR